MESSVSSPPTVANKLLHIFRVVYYMLRKGISKQKLMTDLHLLLKLGKIAGKALRNLITSHHHHQVHHPDSSFSCRAMDPDLSFYNPKEVEFSCSTTPSYPSFHFNRRKNRKKHSYDYEAVEAIAKAFETMNSCEASDAEQSVAPSPMMVGFGKSPRMVRQLRITDSPFPIIKEEEVSDHDRRVDKEAGEFIKRFYEKLRMQQSLGVATPEYKSRRG